eukprot:5406296-Pyramimonas_sp.AAC.2
MIHNVPSLVHVTRTQTYNSSCLFYLLSWFTFPPSQQLFVSPVTSTCSRGCPDFSFGLLFLSSLLIAIAVFACAGTRLCRRRSVRACAQARICRGVGRCARMCAGTTGLCAGAEVCARAQARGRRGVGRYARMCAGTGEACAGTGLPRCGEVCAHGRWHGGSLRRHGAAEEGF